MWRISYKKMSRRDNMNELMVAFSTFSKNCQKHKTMPLDQYLVFMSPKIKQYTCIILLITSLIYELSRINTLISSYQEAGWKKSTLEKVRVNTFQISPSAIHVFSRVFFAFSRSSSSSYSNIIIRTNQLAKQTHSHFWRTLTRV